MSDIVDVTDLTFLTNEDRLLVLYKASIISSKTDSGMDNTCSRPVTGFLDITIVDGSKANELFPNVSTSIKSKKQNINAK